MIVLDPPDWVLPDEHPTSAVSVVAARANMVTDLRCSMAFLTSRAPKA